MYGLPASDQVVLAVIQPLTFVGPSIKVNVADEVAVPPGVVTIIVPVAPAPTTAVILVALTTTNDVAAVPPKLTAVAPVKFVPVIVTVVPTTPLVGVKDVIDGTTPIPTFLNTDIVLLLIFVTTTSLFPSPSISPMETP